MRNFAKASSTITFATLSILFASDISALAADLPSRSFENIPPAESDEIDKTVEIGRALQDKRAVADKTQYGKRLRGVHAKSHGCVKAKFTINSSLPQQYQTGLFATPGQELDAWIRFSNASVLREDDLKENGEGIRTNGSRGMAVKILDIAGNMLDEDNGQSNQDFLMINTPEFAFSNVRDYLRLNNLLMLSKKGDDPAPFFLPLALAKLGSPVDGEPQEVTEKRKKFMAQMQALPAFKDFSPSDFKRTVASITTVTASIEPRVVRNPMQVQYFGAAPFLFGKERAMKFSAAPCQKTDQAPFDNITSKFPSPNYLRETLNRTMKGNGNLCYNFKIQVRGIDQENLKIENANSKWPDEENNYVDVARITIERPQQTQTDEARAQCEALAFSPWHGLLPPSPAGRHQSSATQSLYRISQPSRG